MNILCFFYHSCLPGKRTCLFSSLRFSSWFLNLKFKNLLCPQVAYPSKFSLTQFTAFLYSSELVATSMGTLFFVDFFLQTFLGKPLMRFHYYFILFYFFPAYLALVAFRVLSVLFRCRNDQLQLGSTLPFMCYTSSSTRLSPASSSSTSSKSFSL